MILRFHVPLIVIFTFSVTRLSVSFQVVFTIGGVSVTIRTREMSATASSGLSQKQSLKQRINPHTEGSGLGLVWRPGWVSFGTQGL
jgi:hypothetical protein